MFFVIDSKLGGDRIVLLFFTILLIVANSIYLLTAMRWFLILKLMDLADDIQIEYTKGATYEELAMKTRIVRWLKLIVPEWRVVYGLWQRAAWKRVSKKAVTITRISRVLSATGSGSAFGVKHGVRNTKVVPGPKSSFLDAAKVLQKESAEENFVEEVREYKDGDPVTITEQKVDALPPSSLNIESKGPKASKAAREDSPFYKGSSNKVSEHPAIESKLGNEGREKEAQKNAPLPNKQPNPAKISSKRIPQPPAMSQPQGLIYVVPGTRKIRVHLVENHGLSFKKVGHGVGIRKVKPEGKLAKDPLKDKLTKGLHLIAVGDVDVKDLDAPKVLQIINDAKPPVIAFFSTFKPKQVAQNAVKKVIAANRLRGVARAQAAFSKAKKETEHSKLPPE